jgi:hypothetical protein
VWYDNGSNGAGFYRPQTTEELAKSSQDYFANQYRQNISKNENDLYNQLATSATGQMNQGIKQIQQNNSSRGLLYGGVNAGQEGALRANTAAGLASGKASINSQVESTANQIDQNSINNGLALQQQQQQMQNAIYANAMAQMNAQNGLFSGLLSAGGMVAGGYLAGGSK